MRVEERKHVVHDCVGRIVVVDIDAACRTRQMNIKVVAANRTTGTRSIRSQNLRADFALLLRQTIKANWSVSRRLASCT